MARRKHAKQNFEKCYHLPDPRIFLQYRRSNCSYINVYNTLVLSSRRLHEYIYIYFFLYSRQKNNTWKIKNKQAIQTNVTRCVYFSIKSFKYLLLLTNSYETKTDSDILKSILCARKNMNHKCFKTENGSLLELYLNSYINFSLFSLKETTLTKPLTSEDCITGTKK